MKAFTISCWLIAVLNGCSGSLDPQAGVKLDSLMSIYANKTVHILENKDTLSYAFHDVARQDTAFLLESGKYYLLQQKVGYPDKDGMVTIVMIEGCYGFEGYVHYSKIKELRPLK